MSTEPAAPRRGRPRSGGREAILVAALDLLRERGASRLTTREVAQRAGVSEGSVFYHFTDRTGLLTAVIEDGLDSLRNYHAQAGNTDDLEQTFESFVTGLEPFLDRTLAVLIAAQSDVELRAGLQDFLIGNDFGPHRGINALSAHLGDLQRRGVVRADADPRAAAMMLLGSLFLHASMRQMISEDYAGRLPASQAIVTALARLLSP